MGKVARKLHLQWNHVIIVQFSGGMPRWTYESNFRGVNFHAFRADPDLAEAHEWYVPAEPLTELERAHFESYCAGACGKLYAFPFLVLLAWRVVKNLFTKPSRALLAPAETCITFVNAACSHIGRPVSVRGASGLPDDIMSSPYWQKVDG